jgi:MtfA peptidase
MGRFAFWLVFFFGVLFCIPLFVQLDEVVMAKVLGIILVVGIVVALWYWRIQTRVRAPRKQRIKMNVNDKYWLDKNVSFYATLSKSDKQVFEDRIGIFLADVVITEVDKEVPEVETCLLVASSAVIAFWGLPYWNYGGLREVLVYPTNFNMDNTLNKVGQVQGKVHHGGLMDSTMILSLPALKAGFNIDNDKKNVGIHEFAHLLDKSDGDIDGLPPMLGEEDRKVWIKLVETEIEKINAGKSTIPENAAKNHSEFFATVVEYYKECPKLLKIKHPELFQAMDNMFSKD